MIENPIDPDSITDSPSTLPYAHHVGSAVIRPTDNNKIRYKALSSMEEQVDMQLEQIKEQIELLSKQAKKLLDRRRASEEIYSAKMSFEPLVGHVYHLYLKENGERVLSMIAPSQWGKMPFKEHIYSLKLLADHTWDVVD